MKEPSIMGGTQKHIDAIEAKRAASINMQKVEAESPAKQKEANTEQTKDYTYKLVDANGKVVKSISKEEYIKYKNEPGTDKPTKTTTNPDVYGRKKGGSPSNPKN